MTQRIALFALVLGLAPGGGSALILDFPAPASLTAEDVTPGGAARLPRQAFDGAGVPMLEAQGDVTRQAWRLSGSGMTTGQIMAPLRAQLVRAGYRPQFECRDRDCGGYDFRFASDLLGEPAMHVDLGDFRYLLAADDSGGAVSLLVSRSRANGFVHLTRVGEGIAQRDGALSPSSKSDPSAVSAQASDLIPGLVDIGRAALDDLLFRTGSAELEQSDFDSLGALADFLSQNPGRSVTLVGHTDATGGLEGNIALSRQRAQAVADVLVADYGVERGRLRAEGVGFLAPRASNDSEDGRRANRRVEVVLHD